MEAFGGGPGRFKVGHRGGVNKIPSNLLNRHTQRILEQPDGWDRSSSASSYRRDSRSTDGGLSLLVKAPGKRNGEAALGENGTQTRDAIAEHYKSILLSTPGDAPQTMQRESEAFHELYHNGSGQSTPQGIGADANAPSKSKNTQFQRLLTVRSARGNRAETNQEEKRLTGLMNKYTANIVPRGMKRPIQSRDLDSSSSWYNPPPVSVPVQMHAQYEPQHQHQQQDSSLNGSSKETHSSPPVAPNYFHFPSSEENKAPQQQERRQSSYPDMDKRSYGIELTQQFTPKHNEAELPADTATCSQENSSDTDKQKNAHDDDGGESDEVDGQLEGESEQAEPESAGAARGGADDGQDQVETKYLQMIAQLTEELQREKDRVEELEQHIEEEKSFLETELENLDQGNLDLKGRTVALQRQVMRLTSERQQNLVLLNQLKAENDALTASYRQVEEIATMLQTKCQILEQRRLARQGWSSESDAPISNPPATLDEALRYICELEDLNKALRANVAQ